MVIWGDPERSDLLVVSTGSAPDHHLQAALGEMAPAQADVAEW